MLDVVVMTLGFEPGPLISTVASAMAEGLSEGARIIVFTAAFPDERADRAWRQLQNVVGMMELPKRLGIVMEKREVPLDDFVRAICSVKQVLSKLRELRVKISITGGMRAVGLAVYTAYLLVEWRHEPKLEVYLEGRGMALTMPEVRRLFRLAVVGERGRLLRAMEPDKVYRPSNLAAVLGKDRSTVYRQLRALAERGIVKRVNGGFTLSKLGLLLV
ncbi:MAG: hypothetical protein DRK00_05190 [Thermoprotei archaeon]|nr:MAG: hypothetical protein DRK00_05190 [Thermoprotei archaeon]